MNEVELKNFIIRYSGQYDYTTLSDVTGLDEKYLRSFVKRANLEQHIYNKYSQLVADITANPDVYTVWQLCKKYGFKYKTLWDMLAGDGLKSYLRDGNKKSTDYHAIEIINLLEMYNFSVLEVSKIARKKQLVPSSRQGIYDLLNREGIDVTKRPKR